MRQSTNFWRLGLGLFALLCLGLVSLVLSQSQSGFPDGPATAEQVARGRYLVTSTSSCSSCHGGTSPAAPGWLGGWEEGAPEGKFAVGPFTVYAPNLTPDKETGIGNWVPQQIFNALRTGINDEGEVLCPPMPWPAYRNMTDDDIWAIVAYLKHIKPVQNEVPMSTGPGVPEGQHPDCSMFFQGLPPQPGLPPFPAASEVGVQ